MTAIELLKVLQQVVADGNGDVQVVFDTEAQHYDVHMVPVDSVTFEPEFPSACVVLSENAPHRSASCNTPYHDENLRLLREIERLKKVVESQSCVEGCAACGKNLCDLVTDQ